MLIKRYKLSHLISGTKKYIHVYIYIFLFSFFSFCHFLYINIFLCCKDLFYNLSSFFLPFLIHSKMLFRSVQNIIHNCFIFYYHINRKKNIFALQVNYIVTDVKLLVLCMKMVRKLFNKKVFYLQICSLLNRSVII